jgi:hypothetical protein
LVTGLIVSGGRFHKAFIFSSFMSLILSIMFTTLGWSSKLYVGLSILMLAFSILINQLVESRY